MYRLTEQNRKSRNESMFRYGHLNCNKGVVKKQWVKQHKQVLVRM